MHENEESQLAQLLRMRRHQAPPPEYFENFLREFQERQRAELLRRPAWRIAMERLGTRLNESYHALFGPFSPAHFSYAGASVAVLAIAALYTANMLQHPGGASGIAANEIATGRPLSLESPQQWESAVALHRQTAPVSMDAYGDMGAQRNFELLERASRQGNAFFELTPEQVLALQRDRRTAPPSTPTRQHPHYILDARPATYEPPVSF